MRYSFYKLSFIFVLALYLLSGCEEQNPINPIPTQNNNTNHYIVVLKTAGNGIQSVEAARNDVLAFAGNYNISEADMGHLYNAVLKGFSADLTAEQVNKMSKDPQVAFVEQDQLMYIVGQPVVEDNNPKTILAQTEPWGITRVGGPSTATAFARAWIVDTGINLTHPDLNVNTALSRTFVKKGQDKNTANDLNGHGSHVSGTIAAKNNTAGVIGVAPNAQVIAVKVLNLQGSGYVSDIVAGLNYVYANATNGDVVNCSWGGGISSAIETAISQFATRNDGSGPYVSIAIAAGNSSANAANSSPARVNGTGIYTVSAFGSGDVFASFSNWGNPPIDFSGPGVSVYSTYKNGGYATLSGTSMATPHIAGIILAREAAGLTGIATNGYVISDPDGNADPIAHE
ncbi:MAG: S8 family serine peptidase [Bacteroidota bacterium]